MDPEAGNTNIAANARAELSTLRRIAAARAPRVGGNHWIGFLDPTEPMITSITARTAR